MTRYKEYVQKMLNENKELFDKFRIVHDQYGDDEEKYQEELNLLGAKVMDIVREYENRLCSNTERGMYNMYSAGLAEKFQSEIKKHFPYFDHIGLKVVRLATKNSTDPGKAQSFSLKKINLS